MDIESRRSALERATHAWQRLRSRASHEVDGLLFRLGMPSAVPVADRAQGVVVWFGVKYELRSLEGGIPGARLPPDSVVEPVIVFKLPLREEIGRVSGFSHTLYLTPTSSKKVDRRALREVATAWFHGARIADLLAKEPDSDSPSSRAPSESGD